MLKSVAGSPIEPSAFGYIESRPLWASWQYLHRKNGLLVKGVLLENPLSQTRTCNLLIIAILYSISTIMIILCIIILHFPCFVGPHKGPSIPKPSTSKLCSHTWTSQIPTRIALHTHYYGAKGHYSEYFGENAITNSLQGFSIAVRNSTE